MAKAEQGSKEGRFFTRERKGTLLQTAGVIVTGFELLARGSLLGTAAGIVIFEAGRRYKKSKKK